MQQSHPSVSYSDDTLPVGIALKLQCLYSCALGAEIQQILLILVIAVRSIRCNLFLTSIAFQDIVFIIKCSNIHENHFSC
ncbi:hypothetical protein [Wolbachia endosymbiont (group A) of Agelastica alni]|uniref:hypothetical protein n=1 Tax=Wolbachia endosymbiont (group A) of Agelastica alni TaxID=3066130 RepID=UPI0031332B40